MATAINKNETTEKYKPFLGLFYTFLSSTTFVLSSTIVKKLPYISLGQLTFVRNAGVFSLSLPIAVFCVKNVIGYKKDRILLIMRGVVGTTAFYLIATAYAYLPLADAAIVLSITPAMTVLVARVYLKERCGFAQIFSLVITLCGVLLAAHIPEMLNERGNFRFDYTYLCGLAAAVGSVLSISVTVVILRKMKHIHFSIPMLYFGFFGMIETTAISVATSSSYVVPQCGWDQVMYLFIAINDMFSIGGLTLATQVEAAGIVSVERTSLEIIVAIAFQVLFFKENPDLYTIVGACLVISSLSILGIRNWLLRLPPDTKVRKRLNCLLL